MRSGYGPEERSHAWDYPTELDSFLAELGSCLDDHKEAKARVSTFSYTLVARRMPIEPRTALRDAGCWKWSIPTRP
jgi:hypothetical protein